MKRTSAQTIKKKLDHYFEHYHQVAFIEDDPISIPHLFQKQQDIEIAAFWVAMLSWGNRTTIINKSKALMELLDHAPHDFVLHHQPKDRKRFASWVHRTFQYTDSIYFLEFFQQHYHRSDSLESLFLSDDGQLDIGLFHNRFFSLADVPKRTRKHVSTPIRGSRCKRICMFLRWMVRQGPVDFGLWTNISTADLLCPLDLHVDRVARSMGLITRKQSDWQTVNELTDTLRNFDSEDPVKYDFALFGLGVTGTF
ncbi:MAG: TIGR02757 family protein [Saprospiraceae bacterium]|nr:TIGR02757 family protein [Saprospiraceae bacterium]